MKCMPGAMFSMRNSIPEVNVTKAWRVLVDGEDVTARIRQLESELETKKSGGLRFGLEGPKFHPFVMQMLGKRDVRIKELEAQHEDLVRRNAALRDRPDMKPERIRAVQELTAERDAAKEEAARISKVNEDLFLELIRRIVRHAELYKSRDEWKRKAEASSKKESQPKGCCGITASMLGFGYSVEQLSAIPTVSDMVEELIEGRQAKYAFDGILKHTGCECMGDVLEGWDCMKKTIEGLRFSEKALISEIEKMKRGES